MRPVIQKRIEKWCENGVIKRAKPNTPHNSPIFTVRKKNSEGEYTGKEHRVVIDCRLINNALDPEKLERFPLPLISDLHRKMSKHSLYTVIDLSQCFHAFKVAKASRPYLTFTDMNGLTWSFSHCPYGLTMVSSHAQKILSNLLADLSDVCTHFIDDVTIHTENDLQKHTEVVKTVIDRLTRANLRINTEKMHIAQKSIYILGFCLSSNGLALDPRKVSNVLDWDPVVKSSRELMSRLGLINFFRSNLPCLSRLTAPLDKLRNAHDITKVWKPEHTALMKQLQELLVSSAVLSVPNLNYPICVVTDSSAYAIGAAMYQVINNKVKYLGFIARSLGPSEQRWGSSKRELAAVVYAFKKFHQWLYGRPFHLFVDNRGILFLHTKPKLDRMVENYYDTIFEMDFDITFCSGINNILADTLSRLFWPYNTLVESGNTRSIRDIDREILIKQDIVKQKGNNKKRKNTHDDEVVAATKNKKQRVLNEEEKGKKDIKGAQDKNTVLSCESSGISNSSKVIIPNKTSDLFNNSKLTAYANSLKRKNEDFYFCVSHLDVYQTPTTDEEKQSILEKSHLLGHFGIHAMEQVIHQDLNMHWKGLREDINQYIRNCHKYRQFNLAKHVYHPPKQEAPEGIMDHVVFDLGGFDCTTSRGNNFILVVLDLFSRFIVLHAISDKSATTVAKELVSIFSLLGYPRVVGHDRGAEFHNVLLEKILKHAGVENRASLAFTPQGNSCCEAAVKNCKTIIMKILEGRSEDWDLYLNGTALSLNVHRSRLHGMMPFVVMFHRLPNEFKDYRGDKPVLHEKEIDVKAFKEKLDLIDRIIVPAIRDQIMKTQDKDSKYFRKRHRILENPYPVGSTVMIKNIENKNRKTDPNYEGPFYVHGHTRNGSYILTDRTNSFLARDVPTQQIKLISTSDTRDNPSNAYVVEAIINHKGSAPNYKYLVKWKGYSEDWNSWEPPSMFDSPDVVKQYWARVNANNSKTSKGKAPKALSTREIATRETKSRNKRERLLAKDDV
ncbi:bck1-like resistance to osmotic shock [Mucor velutinosus]|uniref:Bck1-like resistance to osmotic shock n=1 Tax=Mucor velutinosus TaxID=708070 RepID=A0AAN7DFV3_9FUNG|nr:bck1-like resistance to osmotic shock [Mucor velutinosus]